MQIVVNNYNQDDLNWLPEGDVIVCDKKDLNVGSNIYDYMDYIIKHYENLPDLMLFTKGNMLKRHITPEEWDKIKDSKTFTPILTQKHDVVDKVSYYEDGLYYEVNNYWYANHYGIRSPESFEELIDLLGVRGRPYLGFAPGACMFVTKENILKHPKKLYEKIKDAVSYASNPGEAHLVERSLVHLWK